MSTRPKHFEDLGQGCEPYPEAPGEPIAVEPVPCTIEILASPKQRSFDPPIGVTGQEVFRARLNREVAEEAGERIQWSVVRGPTDGDVLFESPNALITKVRARRPNKAKVKVQLISPAGAVVCQDEKDISVPQIFFVQSSPGLTRALEDFGLQVAITPGDSAAEAKRRLNRRIQRQLIARSIGLAAQLYRGLNVRFTTLDPTRFVGAGNFSRVAILGPDPAKSGAFAVTFRARKDEVNARPNEDIFIFAQEYSDPQSVLGGSPLYEGIFRGIALRRKTNAGPTINLGGSPVQLGEFVPRRESATTFRQLRINAAFLALARLLGETLAHEAGHALSLVPGEPKGHNPVSRGNLMDKGPDRSFAQRTGIYRFDSASGALSFGPPSRLSRANRRRLERILPILT